MVKSWFRWSRYFCCCSHCFQCHDISKMFRKSIDPPSLHPLLPSSTHPEILWRNIVFFLLSSFSFCVCDNSVSLILCAFFGNVNLMEWEWIGSDLGYRIGHLAVFSSFKNNNSSIPLSAAACSEFKYFCLAQSETSASFCSCYHLTITDWSTWEFCNQNWRGGDSLLDVTLVAEWC